MHDLMKRALSSNSWYNYIFDTSISEIYHYFSDKIQVPYIEVISSYNFVTCIISLKTAKKKWVNCLVSFLVWSYKKSSIGAKNSDPAYTIWYSKQIYCNINQHVVPELRLRKLKQLKLHLTLMLKNVDPNKGQRERISVKDVKQVIITCLSSLCGLFLCQLQRVILNTGKYSPPFYFCPFRPYCHRANIRLGELHCLK